MATEPSDSAVQSSIVEIGENTGVSVTPPFGRKIVLTLIIGTRSQAIVSAARVSKSARRSGAESGMTGGVYAFPTTGALNAGKSELR